MNTIKSNPKQLEFSLGLLDQQIAKHEQKIFELRAVRNELVQVPPSAPRAKSKKAPIMSARPKYAPVIPDFGAELRYGINMGVRRKALILREESMAKGAKQMEPLGNYCRQVWMKIREKFQAHRKGFDLVQYHTVKGRKGQSVLSTLSAHPQGLDRLRIISDIVAEL